MFGATSGSLWSVIPILEMEIWKPIGQVASAVIVGVIVGVVLTLGFGTVPALDHLHDDSALWLWPGRVGLWCMGSLGYDFIGIVLVSFAIWTTYQLKLLADGIGAGAAA